MIYLAFLLAGLATLGATLGTLHLFDKQVDRPWTAVAVGVTAGLIVFIAFLIIEVTK